MIEEEEVVFPAGTLWGGVKIQDERTWQEVEEGRLRGFSPTYFPCEVAGYKIIDIFQGNVEMTEEIEKEINEVMKEFKGTGPNGRITLKDLKYKFGKIYMVSIGLVSKPAVSKSF